MKEKILAIRYGEAFLSYAREGMPFGDAVEELRKLKLFLSGEAEFMDFLKDPQVPKSDKFDLINKTIARAFRDEIGHFLKLLVEKDRIGNIFDICDYVRTTYSYEGAIGVLLTMAYPLDTDLIRSIQEKLIEKFNKKMNFFIKLDANLMGGIKVLIGNILIDGSLQCRLQELKNKLMKVKIA